MEKLGLKINKGKLILESVDKIEIPLLQILFINFEADDKNPIITINLMSGTKISLRVDRKAKQEIKDLINNGRAEIITLELRKN